MPPASRERPACRGVCRRRAADPRGAERDWLRRPAAGSHRDDLGHGAPRRSSVRREWPARMQGIGARKRTRPGEGAGRV